jgi:serine/threonine protein kinase
MKMFTEINSPRDPERASGHTADMDHIGSIGWTPGGWETPQPTNGGLAGYRLGARLDSLGEIYEGRHPRLSGPLVIKLFGRLTERSSAAVAAFSKEAGRVSILRHPHIARVFDSGVFGNGTPFVAMEHLHGRTLEEHLTLRGPLPLAQLLPVLRGVVSGLSAAHAAGVVHREIRPDNVFLVDAAEGEPGLVKLLDFGVSRLTWALESERRGVNAEGVRYLAPEQTRGAFEDVDARADQYAVAALVCRMLHGSASLPGGPAGTRSARAAEPGRRIGDQVMRRVAAVRNVLSKALSESPGGRYQSVTAFLHAFEEALAGPTAIASVAPVEQSSPSAGVADSATGREVEMPAERLDRRSHRVATGPDGALTKRFFLEGDLQEKNEWKNSPLARDRAASETEVEFSSFDQVPRKRKPLVAVAIVVALLVAGLGASRAGWPSPGNIWRDSRLGRTAYLLRAGLPRRAIFATAMASAMAAMNDPQVHAHRAEPTTPLPGGAIATVEASTVAARSLEPIAPVEISETASVPAPDLPGSETVPAISLPDRRADADEAVSARQSSLPVAAVARADFRPADAPRRKRSEPLRGYVWSPTDHRLVPSSFSAAPPDTAAQIPVVNPTAD